MIFPSYEVAEATSERRWMMFAPLLLPDSSPRRETPYDSTASILYDVFRSVIAPLE